MLHHVVYLCAILRVCCTTMVVQRCKKMLVHCTMMCNEACTTVFAQGCVVHAMYNTSLYNVQWYFVKCTKVLVQCTIMCTMLAQGCIVQCTTIPVQQQPISSLSAFQPRRPKPQHQTFTQLSNKQLSDWTWSIPSNKIGKYNCFYHKIQMFVAENTTVSTKMLMNKEVELANASG